MLIVKKPVTSDRRLSGWKIIGALLFGALLIVLLVVWSIQGAARRRYDAALAAAKERGAPTTLDEMNRFYAPPRDNPVDAILTAYQNLIERPGGEAFFDGLITQISELPRAPEIQWSDSLIKTVEGAAEPFADEIQGVVAASLAAQGPGWFAIEWQANFLALLDHVDRLRKIATLLEAEAILAEAADDDARYARAVRASLRLANLLKNEPLVVSQSVRMSLHRKNVALTSRGLGRFEALDSNEWSLLREELEQQEFIQPLRRALQGEAALLIFFSENVQNWRGVRNIRRWNQPAARDVGAVAVRQESRSGDDARISHRQRRGDGSGRQPNGPSRFTRYRSGA